MKRKITAIVLTLAMCFAMTGCMAAEYQFNFNKDASGTMTAGCYFSDEFIEAMGTTVDEMFEESDGEVVQKTFGGKSYHGATQTMKFKDIAELKEILADNEDAESPQDAAEGSLAWTFDQTTENGQSLLTITMNLSSDEEISGDAEAAPIDTTGLEEDIKGILYVSMDFTFPGGIKSVTGLNSGYKIDGTKLHIDVVSSDAEQVVKIVGVLDESVPAPMPPVSNEPFTAVKVLAPGKFTDVPSDAWYANSLKAAYEYGFVNGTTESTFSPNNNLSIAHIAQICANVRSVYDNDADTLTALRADGGKWYDGAVAYCIQKGIMSSEEEFGSNMNKPCTRAEMCQFFSKVLPDDAYTHKDTAPFTDVTSATPYAAAIEKLHSAGIVNGYGNGTFGPTNNVTRAQSMVFIANIASMASAKK